MVRHGKTKQTNANLQRFLIIHNFDKNLMVIEIEKKLFSSNGACVIRKKVPVGTLLLGQALALRAVVGQRVDWGPVVLLLAGAVRVVGRRAVARRHLEDTTKDTRGLRHAVGVRFPARAKHRS